MEKANSFKTCAGDDVVHAKPYEEVYGEWDRQRRTISRYQALVQDLESKVATLEWTLKREVEAHRAIRDERMRRIVTLQERLRYVKSQEVQDLVKQRDEALKWHGIMGDKLYDIRKVLDR